MSRIEQGRRVICRKPGPYDGKRGVVEDVWAGGEIALVEFDGSSLSAKTSYFELVHSG